MPGLGRRQGLWCLSDRPTGLRSSSLSGLPGTQLSLLPLHPHSTPTNCLLLPDRQSPAWMTGSRLPLHMRVCTCVCPEFYVSVHTPLRKTSASEATGAFPTFRNICSRRWEVVRCKQAPALPLREGTTPPAARLPSLSILEVGWGAKSLRGQLRAPAWKVVGDTASCSSRNRQPACWRNSQCTPGAQVSAGQAGGGAACSK